MGHSEVEYDQRSQGLTPLFEFRVTNPDQHRRAERGSLFELQFRNTIMLVENWMNDISSSMELLDATLDENHFCRVTLPGGWLRRLRPAARAGNRQWVR